MKTTININGKSVEIELTADQVAAIKKTAFNYKDFKSVKDAISYLGDADEDVQALQLVEGLNSAPAHLIAYLQLIVICKALNEVETMDYKNIEVYKYYPWFNSEGSVSGFSFGDYGYGDVCSDVGARLCLKSSEIAEYAGTQFLEIYNAYIN